MLLKTDEMTVRGAAESGKRGTRSGGTGVTLTRVRGCPSSPVMVVPLGMARVRPGTWLGRTSARSPGVMAYVAGRVWTTQIGSGRSIAWSLDTFTNIGSACIKPPGEPSFSGLRDPSRDAWSIVMS